MTDIKDKTIVLIWFVFIVETKTRFADLFNARRTNKLGDTTGCKGLSLDALKTRPWFECDN